MKRRGTSSFTLIEMLVVIAVVMILYVLLLGPSAESSARRKLILCEKNLQQLSIALKMYATDYHDAFPVVPGAATSEAPLSLLVPRYTSDTSLFICPGSGDRALREAVPFPDRTISYAYCMGRRKSNDAGALLVSDRQVDTIPKIEQQLIFSPDGKPPGNNHRQFGGNLLFCDGHIETSPPHAGRALPLGDGVVLLNPRSRP